MPHSIVVSKLMTNPREWPQFRAGTKVGDVIKILRIISEDEKLEHGHSTPLVFDDDYNLLGFVRLTNLLKSIRRLWEKESKAEETNCADLPVKQLVIPFAGTVAPEDSILKALDIMMDEDVSLVPVMKAGKLAGLIKLSDIFNTVSALLFDEQDPDERHLLVKRFHL